MLSDLVHAFKWLWISEVGFSCYYGISYVIFVLLLFFARKHKVRLKQFETRLTCLLHNFDGNCCRISDACIELSTLIFMKSTCWWIIHEFSENCFSVLVAVAWLSWCCWWWLWWWWWWWWFWNTSGLRVWPLFCAVLTHIHVACGNMILSSFCTLCLLPR